MFVFLKSIFVDYPRALIGVYRALFQDNLSDRSGAKRYIKGKDGKLAGSTPAQALPPTITKTLNDPNMKILFLRDIIEGSPATKPYRHSGIPDRLMQWMNDTNKAMRISDACKIECDRQHVGEVEHVQLIEAYDLTLTPEWQNKTFLTLDDILTLSVIVEPQKANTLRRTPVTFANGSSGLAPDLIPRALEALLENQAELSTDTFVKEFLIIHPFLDGNGRTAFTLYNLLSGNRDYPVSLPDYFG